MNWKERMYTSLTETVAKKARTKLGKAHKIGKQKTAWKKHIASIEKSRKAKKGSPSRGKEVGTGMKGLTPGEAAEFGGDTTNDPRTTGRRG